MTSTKPNQAEGPPSPDSIIPTGCGVCGRAQRGHLDEFNSSAGWHRWVQPAGELIKARMHERAAARAWQQLRDLVDVALREIASEVCVSRQTEVQTSASEIRRAGMERALLIAVYHLVGGLDLAASIDIRDRLLIDGGGGTAVGALVADQFSPREVDCLIKTAVELWEAVEEADLSERQMDVLDRARTAVTAEYGAPGETRHTPDREAAAPG